MQTPAIEDAVEDIATALGRGLSLEDLDGVLIAYSRHQGAADRVRVNFLLSKKVPADVHAWQMRHGVGSAVRPVAVPANAELGMLGRVCVPLLVRGFRVGYLWVQQDAEEDSAGAILAALRTVRSGLDRLAELLLEGNTADSQHRSGREAAFLAACGGVVPAVEELRGWRDIDDAAGPWHLAVVVETGGPRRADPDPQADTLKHSTVALQATVGVVPVLFSAGAASHAVFLATGIGRATHATVLERYRQGLAQRTGREPGRLVLGISETFTDLRGLPGAYSQAGHAAQAGAVDQQLGEVVEYRAIGAYQFLAAMGWQLSAAHSVYFTELEEQDGDGELLPVLELLYDKNGSVQDVATQLHLHRSSVYNRLARMRSIIGADPLAGGVRLELHLALKARRWMLRPRF